MNERFMITVFIRGAELQVSIQVKPQLVIVFGKNDALIWCAFCKNNFIGIRCILTDAHELIRGNKTDEQAQDGNSRKCFQVSRPWNVVGKTKADQERYDDIQDAEKKRGADEAEERDKDKREDHRSQQCTDIVECKNAGNKIAEFKTVF